MAKTKTKPRPLMTVVRCYACGGKFALGYGPHGYPCASHTEPTCPAYDAIDSSDQAVAFSQRCRAAVAN